MKWVGWGKLCGPAVNNGDVPDSADSPAPGGAMGLPERSVRTAFRPMEHGFPFPNCFPCGKPVWTLPTPVGRIPIGDASKGLCGGMVFAACDYLHSGRPVPRDPDADGIYPYLARRLWHSFHVPWGVCRIYRWMGLPDSARTGRGSYPTASVPFLTAQREWPVVREFLSNRAEPVPLMLIKTDARDPRDMGLNHQVLAYGYDEDPDTGEVAVRIYDPNYPIVGPADEDVTLRFNTRTFDGRRVVHSREGESVRGFFRNRYTPVKPPG